MKEIKNKDKLVEVAKKVYHEFDDVEYVGEWEGYKVYSPFISDYDGPLIIGYPLFVLEKDDEIRLNEFDETFKIMDVIDD